MRRGRLPSSVDGGEDPFGGEGNLGDADADGVFDGVGDGGGDGDAWSLAHALGAEGAVGGGDLDELGDELGDVRRGGEQVLPQIGIDVGARIADDFFLERVAEAVDDAALDLAFARAGVEGAADVLG